MRRVHSSVTDRMETAEEQSVLCQKRVPISRGLDLLGEKETDRQTDRQTENLNSKTLFYKDCSLASVKNLTTSPC